MPNANLLDIAKINGSDKVVGMIETVITAAPELMVIPARTIKGTNYKTLLRTAFPDVGFRAANGSTTAGKSSYENRLVECFILSSLITADKAVAKAHEDGENEFKANEIIGVGRQAMIEVGKQVFYGTNTTFGGDSLGFPGLLQCHDATNMVVDAGGTTDNVASSVYIVCFGDQDVKMVYGGNTTLELSDWTEQVISGVPSFVSDLTAWIGLQVVNPNSVVRIKKLTTDSGKGLTDSVLADAFAKFPVDKRPDAIFMNRRSRAQLQKSRTVTLFGGPGNSKPSGSVEVVAPTPTSYEGVPIVTTDNIISTETLAL
jgi:hypothetical protein